MQAAKLAGPATLSASGALLFVSLFFGDATSNGRLFWIGAFALVAAAIGLAVGPVPVPRRAGLAVSRAVRRARRLDRPDDVVVDRPRPLVGGVRPDPRVRRLPGARPARRTIVRGRHGRWQAGLAVLVGLVLAWSLAGKVVPSLFPDGARVARLRNPVGYWNSLALVAATAVPLGLWLARRRAGTGGSSGRRERCSLYLAELVVVLTYSRAGIAVAALAALAWLALSRERLESLVVLVLATPVAALVALWAFSRPAITDDLQPYADRVDDGAWFGVLLCVGAAVVCAVAFAIGGLAVSEERRRAYTMRLGAVLAVVALAAVAAVLVRNGGAIADEFRGTPGKEVTQDPTRLAELSSSNRWTWWKEAWSLFEDAPAGGKGAATFEIARRGIRSGSIVTTEPHDLPIQFLAETGVVGFLLLLGLIGAGVTASISALRRAGPERGAVAALAIGVGAYAVHSLVDIHWDFVAVSAPAFFSLGVLAGLGAALAPASTSRGNRGGRGCGGSALLAHSPVRLHTSRRLRLRRDRGRPDRAGAFRRAVCPLAEPALDRPLAGARRRGSRKARRGGRPRAGTARPSTSSPRTRAPGTRSVPSSSSPAATARRCTTSIAHTGSTPTGLRAGQAACSTRRARRSKDARPVPGTGGSRARCRQNRCQSPVWARQPGVATGSPRISTSWAPWSCFGVSPSSGETPPEFRSCVRRTASLRRPGLYWTSVRA